MTDNATMEYAVCESSAGWLAMLASPSGLVRIVLPQPTAQEALQLLGVPETNARESTDHFKNLVNRLQDYFRGQPVEFADELDVSTGTSFDRAVWSATRRIPRGQTQSYGWVANQIGKPRASRAVGRALGRNPLPIVIPCHRVVAADGSLHGFRGGLPLKKQLLSLERV